MPRESSDQDYKPRGGLGWGDSIFANSRMSGYRSDLRFSTTAHMPEKIAQTESNCSGVPLNARITKKAKVPDSGNITTQKIVNLDIFLRD